MAETDSTAEKETTTLQKLDEASLFLYRALSLNSLLFNASCFSDSELDDDVVAGATDTMRVLISDAKALIDSVNRSRTKNSTLGQ